MESNDKHNCLNHKSKFKITLTKAESNIDFKPSSDSNFDITDNNNTTFNEILEIHDVINNITTLNESVWSDDILISKIWHELLLNILYHHRYTVNSIKKCLDLTEVDRFIFFKTIVNTDYNKTYISFINNMSVDDKYGVILFLILKTYYETDISAKNIYISELSSLLTYYWTSLESNILIENWHKWSYLIDVIELISNNTPTLIWSWSTRFLPWIFILNNLALFDIISFEESKLIPIYPFKNNIQYYPLHLPFLFKTQIFTEAQLNIIFMRRFQDGLLGVSRTQYIKECKSVDIIEYNSFSLHNLFEVYENAKPLTNEFIKRWKSVLISYGIFSIVNNIDDLSTLIEMKQNFSDYWFNALNDDEELEHIKIIFDKYIVISHSYTTIELDFDYNEDNDSILLLK
jgi:hypothetical protein